jgi:2-oxoglutarate ferredoxin oxidoreductase subunit gamma
MRKDINIYKVEPAVAASDIEKKKIFNMIVLGGYLKIKPIVKMENVIKGLKKSIPERNHKLLPLNEQAIDKGMEIVELVQKA